MEKLIKENRFLQDLLENFCEYDEDKNTYYYKRRDGSGRDYYDYIPLDCIHPDELDSIIMYATEKGMNGMGIEDYQWEDHSIEEVVEWIDDNLENLLVDVAEGNVKF